MDFRHDVIIVGSGLAGLRAALEVASHADVALLSKVYPTRSHSGAAQGGIAAALGNEEPDSWEWHMYDTVKGGDYLTDQDAADYLARDAARAVYELEHLGVPFNRTADGRIAQRAFGGHTSQFGQSAVKRACHAADRSGRVILDTLYWQVAARGVKTYPEFQVLDLIRNNDRFVGVVAYQLATGELHVFQARQVLLATGGFGKVFKTTSNCFANTGDGLSLAYRHGIPLEDMEFVQFHPTGIHRLGVLISEAARGEGGILRNDQGEAFMERYAPTIKDLAARDVVSRAIHQEVLDGRGINGQDYVHLDLTHLGAERIAEKLSDISSFVRIYLGIDPVTDLVPVAPTCHYMMGGIPVNLDGRVLNHLHQPAVGLYAAGECSCLSLHGANRLGCNSLLDLVVFGRRTGLAMAAGLPGLDWSDLPPNPIAATSDRIRRLRERRHGDRAHVLRSAMQQVMTTDCSVYRHRAGLNRALSEVQALLAACDQVMIEDQGQRFNTDLLEALELEGLLQLAETIAVSALAREESRGAHYREDFPERDDTNWLQHGLVRRTDQGPEISYKPVTITRFQPKPRVY
jgi:succinate dehydrogenase / fumarate reductase, flavoprotein subunit